MKREPFFETDTYTLYLDETLVYYDGPQLVICKDENETKYLAVCSGWFEKLERWVAVKISEERWQAIYNDQVTLYDAFKEPEDDKAIVFEQSFETQVETSRVIEPSTLDDGWLPTPGFYLEARE